MKINGKRLKCEMRERGLSLNDVANALNVSVAIVSKWRNEKKNISKGHLYALAHFLKKSPAALLGSDEPATVIRCWKCKYYKNKTCFNSIIPHPQPDKYWYCSDAAEKD